MVEIRFKPSDVGTVPDGSVTDVKVAAGAAIAMDKLTLAITNAEVAAAAGIDKSKLGALEIADADVAVGAEIAKTKLAPLNIINADVDVAAAIVKSKLAALAIADADVDAITVTKVTGAVDGRAASTTGDKDVTAIGFDSVTEEVVIDREE